MATNETQFGAENVGWDLTRFYSGAEDKAIAADVAKAVEMMAVFEQTYKGKLATKLGDALDDYWALVKLNAKPNLFFFLSVTRDTTDSVMRRESSKAQEALTVANARHMTFFELEVARLSDAEVEAQMGDRRVAHHAPWIKHLRTNAKYFLDDAVEQALTLRQPYGPGEWSDMMEELDAALRFTLDGKEMNLSEALNILVVDTDPDRRATVLKLVNDGLNSQKHTFFMARTLNVAIGSYLTDIDARGYTHVMQPVNVRNMVDDATVDALHDAVKSRGAELGRRFYKLKARLLKLEKLRWSDRNAPMPFVTKKVYNWKEACAIAQAAYEDFSPTLGKLVAQVLDPANGWVDAPPRKTKTSGAFDYTVMLPEDTRSYMMLNYMGGSEDVMTLAHELGHAVHGMLAAEAQGPMMWHAPMPYAETASIFGEMLTFESLLGALDDRQEKLALYMGKINDFLNTVVRQINFSEVEKAMYAKRREGKLAAEDFSQIWMETTKAFYGADGEVFAYNDMENMWAYVGHFHNYNFYVYAYAFGELFTQSMMAERARLGGQFEPLYLGLLRAGGTKGAVGLMEPFGLNPDDADFWAKGIDASLGVWLQEAEKLADELGL
ncbi:MAG: hypothetical protein EON60_10565 [Alphaproteobacteria bacterium]|nr:MAG: hypothetical protein EON60_10565 [Alphaproteobacteria bacterium]